MSCSTLPPCTGLAAEVRHIRARHTGLAKVQPRRPLDPKLSYSSGIYGHFWCGIRVISSYSAGLDPPLAKSRTPRVFSLARPGIQTHVTKNNLCTHLSSRPPKLVPFTLEVAYGSSADDGEHLAGVSLMGKTKRTKAIGLKKIMAKTDLRLKENQEKQKKALEDKTVVRNVYVAFWAQFTY